MPPSQKSPSARHEPAPPSRVGPGGSPTRQPAIATSAGTESAATEAASEAEERDVMGEEGTPARPHPRRAAPRVREAPHVVSASEREVERLTHRGERRGDAKPALERERALVEEHSGAVDRAEAGGAGSGEGGRLARTVDEI